MLTPDRVYYANGVKVCEKIIPDNAKATRTIASWVQKGQPMKPGHKMVPIGSTIHNTNDLARVEDDAEQYTRATWPNCNMAGTCVHFYVDDLGAWQNLREDESGWHASDDNGDGNRRTIAIEVIMKGNNSTEDKKARENTIKLVAYLMDKYNWTTDNIYTHNHWMKLPDKIVGGAKKNCPIFLLPEWEEFKESCKQELAKLRASAPKESFSESVSTSLLSHEDIKIGDIYNFVGDSQYKSAVANSARVSAKSSRVKVTLLSKKTNAHPVHVRSIDEKGKFTKEVYGWVDIKDLKPISINPYLVKITVDALNIRSGPSTDYKVVSVIKDKLAYTIVEEKNGWGKLKSQIGWINLDYTKKV